MKYMQFAPAHYANIRKTYPIGTYYIGPLRDTEVFWEQNKDIPSGTPFSEGDINKF
jgi:hypothetical protein